MIELVIDQRRRSLGGFDVGRVLPFAKRRMVGPFIFFDHMGPTEFLPGIPPEVDVRPHPHIGLSTITYLFAGEIMHRDSVGSEQPIRPGEVNWMTAGSGITHSERFERGRREGGPLNGIQAWVALPDEDEESDPSFAHHGVEDLPVFEDEGIHGTLVAGEVMGLKARVRTNSPLFYLHLDLRSGARSTIPAEYTERALYVALGTIELGDDRLGYGQMAVLTPAGGRVRRQGTICRDGFGESPSGHASSNGTRFFIRGTHEQAKADWRAGRMKLRTSTMASSFPSFWPAATGQPDVLTS